MRSEAEIKRLGMELSHLTGFIGELGDNKEFKNKSFDFACNVHDAISWVLGEITTEHFVGDGYIDIAKLKTIASNIEARTGQSLAYYE
ncbi:hypothetical protein ES702_06454 [subsurface metagenome]